MSLSIAFEGLGAAELADHYLPGLFAAARLVQISVYGEAAVACPGQAGFTEAASTWSSVIETLGPKITNDGYLPETDRLAAALAWKLWVLHDLICLTLLLRAGIVMTAGLHPVTICLAGLVLT